MILKQYLLENAGAKAQGMMKGLIVSAPKKGGAKKLMTSALVTMLTLMAFTVPAQAASCRTIDNTALEETVNAEYEKKLKAAEADASIQEAEVSTEGNEGEIDDEALSISEAESVAESAIEVALKQKAAGERVVEFASQFIGNPYRYGGSSLTAGTDCSGFVMSVYRNFGISLPHSSSALRSVGTPVASLALAQPGDIICYSGHVGIYIGDGKLLSALGSKYGITINSATYKRILAIRRLV
ncbi:C40 family peptidase [Oribacterium sp. WCC10]|uniref:C40 family peptidase n=1 Tax=Oribacterium sp. WCC10 TaxID=1855343 RepID=UPI0008EC5397|nr:C40 family peptidase [Oribacterium sp. WCC10]SFG15606.1 NlpC/P60 family protein [Oribacterium sp. WCC10]